MLRVTNTVAHSSQRTCVSLLHRQPALASSLILPSSSSPSSLLCPHTNNLFFSPAFHFGSSPATTPDISKLRRKRTSHPKAYADDENEALDDEDDEYIPEMDWDHTRFHDHYERIWEEQKAPPTWRESFYNILLRMFSFTALSVALGCVCFGSFVYMKMRGQLKHVNKTQKSIRKTRKIFEANSVGLIPLSFETMDVTEIKEELRQFADSDGKIEISRLGEECETWKRLKEVKVDIDNMADWQKKGVVSLEDTTYLLALMQYFMAQSRRKGTPSVRRRLRDDLYKMICSYEGREFVTLSNMGAFANACFCLAILSPPNLGKEELGGQNIDDFKINYVKYMLRDEDLKEDSTVPIRRFNFLYKVCDFSLGLTPESQGQLAK